MVGGLAAFGADFLQDLLDPITALDRFVEEELEVRYPLEPQPLPDLPSQERCGPSKRSARLAPGLLVPECRVVHARDLQIWCDLYMGDGQESNARVMNLARDEFGELSSQLIADAGRPRARQAPPPFRRRRLR
jgi:hypothetical protein